MKYDIDVLIYRKGNFIVFLDSQREILSCDEVNEDSYDLVCDMKKIGLTHHRDLPRHMR